MNGESTEIQPRTAPIHRLYGVFQRYFRPRRMRRLVETFRLTSDTRILDLGGTAPTWSMVPAKPRVTLLNLNPEEDALPDNIDHVFGDASERLPFHDDEFDLAFSNSVIEHLPVEKRPIFANEVLRVGRAVWVQTPARSFPVEPHYIAPLVGYFPKCLQRRTVRWMGLWGWLVRPSQGQIDRMVMEISLMRRGEIGRLFPGCKLRRERFVGLTKSWIIVRENDSA